MSDNTEPTYYDGQIVSAKVDDQGVIRVDTFRDGEIQSHSVAREGFMQHGEYIPPPAVDSPLSRELPGDAQEGQILQARVNPDGNIEVTHVVDGEVRMLTVSEEAFAQADPIPREVVISPTAELDAVVHDMAMEARPPNTGVVIEAEPEAVAPTEVSVNGAYTIYERDQYGDIRGHTYDTEPVSRHAAPAVEYDVHTSASYAGEMHGEVLDVAAAHDVSHDDSQPVAHESGHAGVHGESHDAAHAAPAELTADE